MATQSKKYLEVDLKPYYPYGIPILLFLSTIGATALLIVGIHEWLF